jgi:hypothetical protein
MKGSWLVGHSVAIAVAACDGIQEVRQIVRDLTVTMNTDLIRPVSGKNKQEKVETYTPIVFSKCVLCGFTHLTGYGAQVSLLKSVIVDTNLRGKVKETLKEILVYLKSDVGGTENCGGCKQHEQYERSLICTYLN